jgi:hypothetical protein
MLSVKTGLDLIRDIRDNLEEIIEDRGFDSNITFITNNGFSASLS